MATELGIRSRSVDTGSGLPVTTRDVLPKAALGPRGRNSSKINLGAKKSWFHICQFVRRPSMLFLVAILFIAGRGLLSGSIMADLPTRRGHVLPPGSVYRSNLAYARFAANMTSKEDASLDEAFRWQGLEADTGWQPCAERKTQETEPPDANNGYIIVVVNGGLNQQRSAICNGVAVAKLLNATLVIPHLYHHAIWKDRSTFEEIYDVQHFITTLSRDVEIIRQLPRQYAYLMEDDRQKTKVPAWSTPAYYLSEILPLLRVRGALRIDPFANRLSYDNVAPSLQKLRCRANFHALQFESHIQSVAGTIAARMSAKSPTGKYLAVHLRFEKDMVAFSHCLYDGGVREREEMAAFREVGWNGKFTRPGRKAIDPGAVRRAGKCPLTPLEVGLVLQGMGFPRSTPIYLAAGKIYGGLPPALLDMFPNIHSKETLLSAEELAPFQGFSSRLAALDYSLCVASEVFMSTQGGNFPQIVEGHRRYLNRNHWKTVSPDKKALALLLDNQTLQWSEFSLALRAMREENDLQGVTERKREQSLYSYPAPECMCQRGDPALEDRIEEDRGAQHSMRNRGRNLGLGGGQEKGRRERERGEDEERAGGDERELGGVAREQQSKEGTADSVDEADIRIQHRKEATSGRSDVGGEVGDEEEADPLEEEEAGNENPDTERFDIHQIGTNERVHLEEANAWAMDDRPRVGRRLPVGGH